MRRLFYGLMAVVIAISASAFTNVKSEANSGRLAVIYVTGKFTDPLTSVQYYTYSTSSGGITCNLVDPSPCQITSLPGYTLPPSQFPVSDYTPTNFSTQTKRPAL